MKDAVESQQGLMEGLDMDRLDDLRDQMDDLKYDSEYMNDMLNRDYDQAQRAAAGLPTDL